MRHKRNIRIALLASVLAAMPAIAAAQALVLVVRHAERADGGSMASTAEQDPKLSAAGEVRARALATLLASAGIKGIYATEFHRTQDTARPLATLLQLTVETSPSADTARLLSRLRTEHPKDVVLVVAHSSTMPAIIAGLGGPHVVIPDEAYGDLFVIVPGTGVITRLKF